VIVAHDGAAWLPRVAQAVANQTRPVQRVVAVDTGSRDRSGAMLAQAFGRSAVFGMERTTGYGVAVAKALHHRAANTHIPPAGGPREERTEWVWLLHDDCEPAPDALERLLAGAREAPAAAVLGPKVRDWSDRDVLLEAGLTIDRAGRRVTGIEPREADQGQHDGDRDVLAVSSAGMLARRDVWDDVGGFDPGMRLFREDTDFCWRVQAAGYRVRVITGAVVYHVEATARNRRQAAAAPHPRRQDRRNALLVLAGNLPAGPTLSALAGNLVLSTLRMIFFLLAKRPSAALDELAAYASVAGHPLRLLAARRRRSAGRQAAYSRLAKDIPPGRSFRMLAEYAINTLSKSQRAEAVGSHHATDDPSDDDSLLVDTGLVQRLLTSPGVLLFLTLTVVALVAERSLLGSTPLGGGALVPAWGGASGLWQEYLQGFHPMSIGTAANTPPYVAVIAILATLLGGKPWLAVDLILLGCIPLAGVSAFLATRRVTRFVPARVVGALAYALLPVGIGAVAAGRLGTAVLLVLLPPVGVLAGRVLSGPRRRARRAAWAMALLVAVVAAFVPLFWLITVVAMGVGVLAFGRHRPDRALNAAIVAVVPVVLLVPWILDLAAHPAWLFLEAGVARPGLATPGLAARSLLLLSPGGPGLPPYWVTAGVALAAAAALALASGRRAPLVLAGWVVAATGLITAALVSHLTITHAGSADAVSAWPGPALAVAGAGLLLAVVAASDRIPGGLRADGWRSVSGLAVLGLGAVACSAPVLAAAYWIPSGVAGPVRPVAGQVLPEFVAVSSDTGLRLRTLVLQAAPGGGVTYTVLRDADPLIGSQEIALPTAAQRALNLGVATLTAPAGGAAQDQARVLAGFGIGYVLLPAPINGRLAQLLDGVTGLRPVSVTGAFDLWRVAGTTAQVTVVEPGGKVVAVPSGLVSVPGAKAPAAGGTLMLAAPAGDWSATLNGHPLTPLPAPVNGWAQGFRLPSGGGTLSVSRSNVSRLAVVALEALAVLVVIGLGLPGARVAGAAEAEAHSDTGELPAEEEEELVAAGRRAGRGRDRGQDRSRGRRSARRGGLPEVAADAEVPRPAAPAHVASRLRGAVPAGVRVGWPRRGGGPTEPESPFADEPVYADGPGGPEGLVPRQPGAEDLAQTAVFGGRNGGTTGRHGHRAGPGQPAERDPARAGRRRRPGSDPAPPGRWGEGDPRDRDSAAAGGPADYGPARGQGGYPPDTRSGPGRRAAPGPPDGGDDYAAPRRGLGRRAAPVRGAGGSAPDRPGDYPGPRRGSGGGTDQEAAFGGDPPGGQNDFALPARPQGGGHRGRGRFLGHSRSPDTVGEAPRRSMPRGRPQGDDASLSPLPPLPPRAPRRNRWEEGDPHSDGAPPELSRGSREGWDRAPRGERDRATDDERDRARRDEWDEPDR
jgi:GT2 family glycosyltransferase